MYTLITKYQNIDILTDLETKRIVALANKDRSRIYRACSIDAVKEQFGVHDEQAMSFFGHRSEAFLGDDDIMVTKCIYTGRTVKISLKTAMFVLAASSVMDVWKLAARINDLHQANHKERDEAIREGNRMYVTYCGRADATRPNMVMLALFKHVDVEGKDIKRVYATLDKDNEPLEIESMYELLEALGAFTHPYQVEFTRSDEMDAKVIEFFNRYHKRSIVEEALEFIDQCATTNQLPITSGDAAYIQHS